MSNTPLSREEEEALSLQLAMQLQEEWDKQTAGAGGAGNVAGDPASEKAPVDPYAGLSEEEKKKLQLQEDLDLQLAMKLQEGEWEEKAKPQPVWTPPPFIPQPYKPDRKEIKAPPTADCVRRLVLDLKEIVNSNNPTIHVVPDEDDITSVQALIIGGEGTPYEHGFFHFDMQFPSDYPWAPPKVLIITTDGGAVRFNPNLYSNGKVCLSILGTWQGPSWTEIQTMLSTLLSIQSLMNEKPYHNEPGHEMEIHAGEVERYNECIEHETLRVAVCGMMENPTCGEKFRDVMADYFLAHYDFYVAKVEQLRHKDGKPMMDPYGEQRGNFRFGSLLSRLAAIKKNVEERKEQDRKEAEAAAAKAAAEESDSEDEDSEEEDEEDSLVSKKTKQTPSASTTTTTTTPKSTSTPSTTTTAPASLSTAVPMETTAGEQKAGEDIYSNPPAVAGDKAGETGGDVAAVLSKTLDSIFTGGFSTSTPVPQIAGQDPSQPVDPDLALAMQLQAQMELDIEFAKKLQDEMNSEEYGGGGGGGHHYGGGGGHGHYGGGSSSGGHREYKSVKAPTLEELKSQAVEPDNPDYDPSVVCLICKDSPKTYIVLPSCEQPHIYCFSCAQRSQQTSRQDEEGRYGGGYGRYQRRNSGGNTSSITCMLCKSVSKLDPSGGLSALKRRRKRKRDDSSPHTCLQHKEEFTLYCHDDAEMICVTCRDSSHKLHKVEGLSAAKASVCKQLEGNMRTLETKWSNLEKFVATVKGQEDQLSEQAEKVRATAKEELKKLREMLEQKEKEIDESITRTEERKKRQIQNEVEKAQQHLEKIPSAISVLTSAMEESDPKKFFELYEGQEEDLRHIVSTAAPEVKKEWMQMPRFSAGHTHLVLGKLQYVDRPQFYGDLPAPGAPLPYYSDDEDY